MPFWRIVPPPPRPWAQSVAPAALVGRRIAANPPRPAGAAARTHTRAPSPQGVGSQPKWLHTTNALPIIAPYKHPSCSGVPRQEQWRTVPPLPLPARPPPLTGWIFLGHKQQKTFRMMRGQNGDMKIKRKNYFFIGKVIF